MIQRNSTGSVQKVILLGMAQIILMAACFQAGRMSVLPTNSPMNAMTSSRSGPQFTGETNALGNPVSTSAATAPKPPIPPKAPMPFGEDELPAKVTWNFQGQCPIFMVPWGSSKPEAREPVDEGLRVRRQPKADESEFAVGYEISCELSGDMEITLDFRDFKSIASATDWKIPRIDISGTIYADDDPTDPMHVWGIAHRREANQRLRATATQGIKGPDGKQIWGQNEISLSRDSGRLRLVRQKEWFFYQTAELGSEEWMTISCRPIHQGTFKKIQLGLRSEDLEASSEAVLLNVTIRAAELLLK